MSTAVLRLLKLGSLKNVYRLEAPALCSALQDAARRRVTDKTVWDALLYRAALLRSESSPLQLSLTIDALAKAQKHEPDFTNFLLAEVRIKSRRFLPRDTALLLNGFAKLSIRDEVLTDSLVPTLLRRISERTRWDDLALLSLAFARLGDRARTPVLDRVVAAATPKIDKLDDGHALSLLSCAFTLLPRPVSAARSGSLFLPIQQPASTQNKTGEEGDLPHLAFVELVLAQCERHVWNFRGADVLHLCLALSSLRRLGHDDLIPPRIFTKMEKRMGNLYFELLPVQFVQFLELFSDFPELQKKCMSKLLDEVAYRMRELNPRSCISVLRAICCLGGHPRAHSAAAWRLTRADAGESLSVAECCEVAECFLKLPRLWESREALLRILQGLSVRRLEPDAIILTRLLWTYAEMGVRDTHWFHLCSKLSVSNMSQPILVQQSVIASRVPSLPEEVIADALLAFAKLNFPQLADGAALVTRAASCVTSPRNAGKVLEAAGIFCLAGRRPRELHNGLVLAPLFEIVENSMSHQDFPSGIRLFPFSNVALGSSSREQLAVWRQRVSDREEASKDSTSNAVNFAIASELMTWKGVEVNTEIAIGPVIVPWAIDLVSLAKFLMENPLEGNSAEAWLNDGENDSDADCNDPAVCASEDDEVTGVKGHSEDSSLPLSDRMGRRQRRAQKMGAARTEKFAEMGGRIPPGVSPSTHVLLLPLLEADFFHASSSVRGERQRSKTHVLGTTRFAEISLLKKWGWRVVGVAEHLWSWGAQGDPQTSRQNRELIFKLVSDLDDGHS